MAKKYFGGAASFMDEANCGSPCDRIIVPQTVIEKKLATYYYTGLGGEYSFIAPSIKDKKIELAFKDGSQYDIILTGIPTGKQVLYTAATGTFLWSTVFNLEETATIKFY